MGKRTGIIFNDEMDDFAKPDVNSWSEDAWTAVTSKANWIEPGKRSLSAMSPTVILDGKGDVRLVTGAAGGSKIITAVLMVSYRDQPCRLYRLELSSILMPYHSLSYA